ncbi:MAG: NAD(P)/FAD-dependent oxidoreductase [Oscillospiraceae bacterium]|nr:NAD(P)/FAD-dependent oxidoreductase [Oscillospiraceae bacterium]
MYDALIIGRGPAGLSAALYLCRANLRAAVVGKDGGALEKVEKLENYFGFEAPNDGRRLLEAGARQAKALGAALIDGEVVDLTWDGVFTATLQQGETLSAKAVILATGAARVAPPIPGVREFEGRGVSYCAVCDAFFYKGRPVAVLGASEYALHEAQHLLPVAGSVTLLTNGAPLTAQFPAAVAVIDSKIEAITGAETVTGARFADGSAAAFEGLFIALGTAGGKELGAKLGAMSEGNYLSVGADMATTVPGLFAAGDCIGGVLQVSTAVGEGAKAALSAIQFIRKN